MVDELDWFILELARQGAVSVQLGLVSNEEDQAQGGTLSAAKLSTLVLVPRQFLKLFAWLGAWG